MSKSIVVKKNKRNKVEFKKIITDNTDTLGKFLKKLGEARAKLR